MKRLKIELNMRFPPSGLGGVKTYCRRPKKREKYMIEKTR